MDFILYTAGIIIFVFLATFSLLVKMVRSIRLKKGSAVQCEKEDIPQYLSDVMSLYEQEVLRLGFEYSHCQQVDNPFKSQYSRRFLKVFYNHREKTFATIYPSDLPERGGVCEVEFITFLSGGEQLSTVNGLSHRIIGFMPGVILQDPYAESIQAQWEAHIGKLREFVATREILTITSQEFAEASDRLFQDYIDALEKDRWIEKKDDEGYAVRFPFAMRIASRLMDGESKLAGMRKKRKSIGESVLSRVEAPSELEVECYYRLGESSRPRKGSGWISKIALLLITMMFFALSFRISMSIEGVLIIIGVLLLHEAGHLLGMYIFKYRDLKILFLPFIGAATIGSQRDAKPHQRIIVSFLGPVPGILLGFALLLVFPQLQGFTRDIVLWLLVLNYLNLLPIMPLDGGQIFNIYMARFPYFQVVFEIASALVLGFVFGVVLHAPLMLGIGIFLGLYAFSRLPTCSLLKKMRERLTHYVEITKTPMSNFHEGPREELDGTKVGEAQILLELFGMLKEKPFGPMPFSKKYQIAKSIVDHYLFAIPSILTIVLSLLFYISLFVLPLFIFIIVLVLRMYQGISLLP